MSNYPSAPSIPPEKQIPGMNPPTFSDLPPPYSTQPYPSQPYPSQNMPQQPYTSEYNSMAPTHPQQPYPAQNMLQQGAGYPPAQPQYSHQPNPPTSQPYPPQAAPPANISHTTVVVQNPVTTLHFGKDPVQLSCPSCKCNVVTSVSSSSSGQAWCICFLLFIIGCWLCCFIPFCMDSYQTATHKCPNCKVVLASDVH